MIVDKDDIAESIENIHHCLSKIEDELEVRPGEQTIRGTDGGTIDVNEIRQAVAVARSDLQDIEKALAE